MKLKDKLFIEYPIPKSISCWGSRPGVEAVLDIDQLLESVVDELASDLTVTGYVEATGMSTIMPTGTLTCTSASLSGAYPFQGNRLVKVTYDRSRNVAFLRYFPAVITYIRKLTLEDLENLSGDRLIFFKAYALWKMAEREITILKTVNMNIDNGAIDLSVLEDFRDKRYDQYKTMKEDILIYATVN